MIYFKLFALVNKQIRIIQYVSNILYMLHTVYGILLCPVLSIINGTNICFNLNTPTDGLALLLMVTNIRQQIIL